MALNRQLDAVSHTVFTENVRLNEALSYHVKEAEGLKKRNIALTDKNASLALQKVVKNRYMLILNKMATELVTDRY